MRRRGACVGLLVWVLSLGRGTARGDPARPVFDPDPADPLEVAYHEARDDERLRAPQAAPADDADPAITLSRGQLANGLTFALSPGGTERFVYLRVRHRAGFGSPGAGDGDLAHLVEHLATGPTRQVPEGWVRAFNALGRVDGNAETQREGSVFWSVIPTGSLERALWLEGQRMTFGLDAFDAARVARERRVIAVEYAMKGDDPLFALAFRLRHGVARDLAAVSLGDDARDLDAARALFARGYAPAATHLTLVGAFEPGQARAWIERYLGAVPSRDAPSPEPAAARAPEERELRLRASMPSGPTRVVVWWPTIALTPQNRAMYQGLAATLRARFTLNTPAVRSCTIGEWAGRRTRRLYLEAEVGARYLPEDARIALNEALRRFHDELLLPLDAAAIARPVIESLRDASRDLYRRADRIDEWPDPRDPGGFRRDLRALRGLRLEPLREFARRVIPDAPTGFAVLEPEPAATGRAAP